LASEIVAPLCIQRAVEIGFYPDVAPEQLKIFNFVHGVLDDECLKLRMNEYMKAINRVRKKG
jgi:hypothetical protein